MLAEHSLSRTGTCRRQLELKRGGDSCRAARPGRGQNNLLKSGGFVEIKWKLLKYLKLFQPFLSVLYRYFRACFGWNTLKMDRAVAAPPRDPPGPSPGRGGPALDRPCRAGYAKAVLVGVPGANLVDDRKCWRLKIKNLDDVAINLLIIGLFMSSLYKLAIIVSVLVVLCWTSLSKINNAATR
jgi:hypothetical protein